eukprot:Tamp_15271.p1 GENE.Tamp_15271~~Tamp_15271.p1  ORF type:complete len:384 (-),score=82.11 Tamp_15271:402-1427(-)
MLALRTGSTSLKMANPNSTTKDPKFALLFDCDGVIVLTEELHRLAYNGAFEAFDLKVNGQAVNWDVKYYDILQNTVGGGKPKMKWHFTNTAKAWPTSTLGAAPGDEDAQNKLVDALQDKKTEIYKKIVTEVAEARPGVLRLMDQVLERPDIAKGICSAATKGGFDQVVNSVVGLDRRGRFDVVMAGDDVPRKKPDPIIYQMASEAVGVAPENCVVVEDSLVGLRAAKGAGMKCIITYTESTKDEDFYAEGADAVVPDLAHVDIDTIFQPMFQGQSDPFVGFREAPRAAGMMGWARAVNWMVYSVCGLLSHQLSCSSGLGKRGALHGKRGLVCLAYRGKSGV